MEYMKYVCPEFFMNQKRLGRGKYGEACLI